MEFDCLNLVLKQKYTLYFACQNLLSRQKAFLGAIFLR
jgi:hypothetical protein